ncbi:hypothetical protein [Rathayibacter sp. VKM Ac-2927]|uniref:hypothetical protein n=1 Tax=Rathayibacter sp. VKM Ac-2927 TaxID=2929478 RepID=UPI001FB45698|nr:hypothetical protein [Rathayibacter sp. VKM Ac-2927]MCJ1685529.1 hypothetical protein [Rathayibacter sp. VKM Ac-2927]
MQNSLAESRTSRGTVAVAAIVAAAGIILAGLSAAYIAGMFGLSTTIASQIVTAVSVGGAVLAIALALVSGGIAGAVVATARWAITKWGEKAAIA